MPPKRKTEDGVSVGGSPSKMARKPWSAAEEAAFDKHVYEIVKAHLWAKAKDDAVLAGRGSNGLKAHWDAKWKKMQGSIGK